MGACDFSLAFQLVWNQLSQDSRKLISARWRTSLSIWEHSAFATHRDKGSLNYSKQYVMSTSIRSVGFLTWNTAEDEDLDCWEMVLLLQTSDSVKVYLCLCIHEASHNFTRKSVVCWLTDCGGSVIRPTNKEIIGSQVFAGFTFPLAYSVCLMIVLVPTALSQRINRIPVRYPILSIPPKPPYYCSWTLMGSCLLFPMPT